MEAKIERCSPNDLRRTFTSWQVEAVVPLFPIAQAMGHKDTRMLERVYGRQTPEQLAALMARAMGLPERASLPAVAHLKQRPWNRPDPVDWMDSGPTARLRRVRRKSEGPPSVAAWWARCAS